MLQNTKSTYTKKVAGNTVFQFAGKIITTAISLVIIGYLTRYLGIAGYGTYTTIFAYVSFWGVLADFGFFWILVREMSKPDSQPQKIFNNVLTLKIFFALTILILCSAVGFLIPQYPWSTKIGIAVISASWFWMSLNSTYVGLFQSKLEMYKASITEIIGRSIILAGIIFSICNNYSFNAILEIYILGNFVNFLLNYFLGAKYIKFKFAFDISSWKMILVESFPLAILSVIGLIHFKIDTVILSILKGNIDVGIYGVPYKILETIDLIPLIFVGNIFPILTKYYHGQDPRLKNSIQKSFDFLIILGLPIITSLIILSWQIIGFIAGKDFLTASNVTILGAGFPAPRVLIILAFTTGITFIITVFSSILTVIGKQYKQLWPMAIITIINIILNLIFIPRYSYVAAAIITVFTESIMLVWWSKLTYKYLHFLPNLKILPKVLLATAITGVIIYLSRDLNILLVAAIGIFVYCLIGYLIKLFDKGILRQMIKNNK